MKNSRWPPVSVMYGFSIYNSLSVECPRLVSVCVNGCVVLWRSGVGCEERIQQER